MTIKLFPSDANFFLAKVTDAKKIYAYLVSKGIIVRNPPMFLCVVTAFASLLALVPKMIRCWRH